ncbi:MAG: hypothetical protein V4805_07810 [Pseudomonadota bacterium]
MNNLLCTFALAAICLLPGCSTTDTSNELVARKTNRVLILTALYVDPNIDTVGFNKLTDSVTQEFSSQLRPKLLAAKKKPINVNDKTLKHSVGEKLAIHATTTDAETAVILSIDSSEVKGQYTISLKAQYVDLRYKLQNGITSYVIPTNGFERLYYLSGPQGETAVSPEVYASKFIADLKAAGRLP